MRRLVSELLMIINVNSRFEPSDLPPPSTHTVLQELQGQEAALLAAGFPRRVHGLVHATDSPAVRVVVGKRSPEGLKIYKSGHQAAASPRASSG